MSVDRSSSIRHSCREPGPVSRSPRHSWLPVLLPVLALLIVALLGVTYTLPYYVIAPAPAMPVDKFLRVPEDRAFPHKGVFLVTTVGLKDATALEAVRGWLDPDTDVVRFRQLTGVKPTPQARREFNADLTHSMHASEQVAVVVALRYLGIDPVAQGLDVRVDSGDTGGGSAGLVFTLGLLDLLGSGELTGGHRIAVSGSIHLDGTVGEVDGAAQKTAAARDAKAEYLLVPPGEFNVAVAHAGGRLKVLKVATLDEALTTLAGLGGEVGTPRPESAR